MNQEILNKIKEFFINFFDNSQKDEIEAMFDNIAIIFWSLSNGKITFPYVNKNESSSNQLMKFLEEHYKEYFCEGLEGAALQNESIIFIKSDSDNLLYNLVH